MSMFTVNGIIENQPAPLLMRHDWHYTCRAEVSAGGMVLCIPLRWQMSGLSFSLAVTGDSLFRLTGLKLIQSITVAAGRCAARIAVRIVRVLSRLVCQAQVTIKRVWNMRL